jgi:hypothetical protein
MTKRIATAAMILLAISCGAAAEAYRYESHGKRDPFVSLVGPDRSAITRLGDVASIEDIRLEGIARDSANNRIAVINGEIVKAGYKSGDVEVKSIADRTVTLSISGKEYTVSLPEQGGAKSGK